MLSYNMEVVRKNGYIAGIMSLVASSLFLIFTINFGWNLTGQALGVLTIFFGLLGIGSLWKPNSIGQIASQILENISKNMQESAKSDSHNKQTQKKSDGIQVMTRDGNVNITVAERGKQKTQNNPEENEIHKEKREATPTEGCDYEEAEIMAANFVKRKKHSESVTVTSVVPATKKGNWEVKGYYPVKTSHAFGHENFTIEIDKDGEVVSFKFESGGAWA